MALNQGKKKPHGCPESGQKKAAWFRCGWFCYPVRAPVSGGMFYAMPGVDALGLGGHVPSPRNGLEYITCTQLCGLLDITEQLRRTSCALELIDDALQRRRVVFAQYDTFLHAAILRSQFRDNSLNPFLPCSVRAWPFWPKTHQHPAMALRRPSLAPDADVFRHLHR